MIHEYAVSEGEAAGFGEQPVPRDASRGLDGGVAVEQTVGEEFFL
jgi:hypothetical protein